MLGTQAFEQRLVAHRGGIVRVVRRRRTTIFEEPIGEIGVLLGCDDRWRNSLISLVRVNLLIGGSVRDLDVEPGEIEFIGGDGV